MVSILKMTVLGGIVLLDVGAMVAPVLAQDEPRLCLRFDNKSLVSTSTEGEDAYDAPLRWATAASPTAPAA